MITKNMNNLDVNANKKVLCREQIEICDGIICDFVIYDIDDYGQADFVENMGLCNGDYRKSRSLIPYQYINADWNTFKWELYREDVSLARDTALAFIKNFEKCQEKGKGLYIYSEVRGSGKTMLACVIANQVMNNRDICVKFISMPELLEMTKQSFKDFAERENIRAIYDSELLILDDLGVKAKNDWIDSELFRLIDYRNNKKKVTIITSNIPITKLDEKIDDRIVNRIYSMCPVLQLPEQSVRAEQAKKENMNFLRSIMD